MESLRGNLQQLDGVGPGIERAEAALRQLLYERLDLDEYEDVVLG